MDDFEKRFLTEKPIEYHIVVGSKDAGGDWLYIDPIVTDHPVYAPEREVAIFSSKEPARATNFGVPFQLLCLSCFFHILRRGNRIRSVIMDDKYRLMIHPWRAPCETTAIYEKNEKKYFIEGCKNTGVFWKSCDERPKTVPPFVSCGAFDTNAGCWYEDCPYNAFFEDDVAPFSAI